MPGEGPIDTYTGGPKAPEGLRPSKCKPSLRTPRSTAIHRPLGQPCGHAHLHPESEHLATDPLSTPVIT